MRKRPLVACFAYTYYNYDADKHIDESNKDSRIEFTIGEGASNGRISIPGLNTRVGSTGE